MALYKFTKNILDGKKITYLIKKPHKRFSYIDDVVYYIIAATIKSPLKKNKIPFRILNIGNNKPEKLKII